jgi:hypothetical protein
MKNTPWTIEERQSCRAVVDSARNDILHVDKAPAFHEGEPCGSVTSRGYTAEELTDRIRLLAAGPKLVEALQKIDANAAESVGWIRRIARTALAIALPQFRIGDQIQNVEDKWQGEVIGFEWINGDEMLVCQYRHQDGSLAADDKRWFAPADMRLVRRLE